ncbi:MAG TPA: hypothetical protein VF169_13000 [Albitalea sp.]|uniref:hypothetical protein n=1 Tax=Piscinibacter sp. TaxID=1903157 RepID=UPI002ECFC5F9
MKSIRLAVALAAAQSLAALAAPPAATPAPAPTDVRVISSPAAPLFTQGVASAALHANSFGNLEAPGSGIATAVVTVELGVPAARQFVLEQVAMKCVSNGSQLVYPLVALIRNGTVISSFPLNPLKAASQGVAVGSEQVTIAANGGDLVRVFAVRESSVATGLCFGNLAGRLASATASPP